MSEEKLAFQAEVSRLLDIVANSLYSDKEIFLRELISNASDACDRLRYRALTEPDLLTADPDLAITLSVDEGAGTLTIEDNGVGMSREELVENLGTIARSGTAAFVAEAASGKAGGEDKPDLSQIGQFGVGFYSAFMVADQVEVFSRKAGDEQGWHWASEGRGEFSVGESEDAPARGTRVVLKIKKADKEFLESQRLNHIVKTYSDHIAFPIKLADGGAANGAQVMNTAGALWTRPKSEITEEQYKEFYHHVAHAFDDPWLRLHFRAEGVLEYTGLLFVPTTRPMDIFDPERRGKVKLYVKRVFITDDCEALVPSYLRFIRGVIDTEDLPLNVSRELLQNDPRLRKIRSGVVKRTLDALKKKAEKEPEDYKTFWEAFGPVLKEGLYEDGDQREKILELARFHCSAGDELTSLAGYVERMKEGQEAIYTISGEDLKTLSRSPQLEGFKARGVEVLLLTDPVDEFWMPAIGSYQDKPFKSVTRGGADLDKIKADDADAAEDKDEAEAAPEGLDALLAYIKLALKDAVKDVRSSQRLTESPVCLVADEGEMDIHLERLLKQHRQLEVASQKILEVNPKHPLIRCMVQQVGKTGAGGDLEEAAWLLLDQARILEGEALPDPVAFNRRLSDLVAKGLGG